MPLILALMTHAFNPSNWEVEKGNGKVAWMISAFLDWRVKEKGSNWWLFLVCWSSRFFTWCLTPGFYWPWLIRLMLQWGCTSVCWHICVQGHVDIYWNDFERKISLPTKACVCYEQRMFLCIYASTSFSNVMQFSLYKPFRLLIIDRIITQQYSIFWDLWYLELLRSLLHINCGNGKQCAGDASQW